MKLFQTFINNIIVYNAVIIALLIILKCAQRMNFIANKEVLFVYLLTQNVTKWLTARMQAMKLIVKVFLNIFLKDFSLDLLISKY